MPVVRPALLLGLALSPLAAQPVAIRVDAAQTVAPWRPVWNYFGYDECNYTYMQHGRKLLGELVVIGSTPAYIRAHHLLNNGSGEPGLKWGYTNVYTEDAAGRPVYNWTLMDRIFDTYRDTGTRPLVEIGFMPEALSVKPQPYTIDWPKQRESGSAYPPKDYAKFAELVYQWVRHSVERYGKAEVESWYWELWNEPDIFYWRGTPEEYYKLYDYTADAVKRALPNARMGGPHTTNPGSPNAAKFLRGFLEHCARGRNAATGATGAPLDFVAFHAKGRPESVDGQVRMGIAEQVRHIDAGFAVVASYPEFRAKPIIIGESDPEGCAACSARTYPQNAYRNGTLYAVYTAAMLKHTLDLAARHKVHLEGAVTWAFEFEGQPYFDGFRTLATNGIDKPVLNAFRMFGLMGGERVAVSSGGAAGLEAIRTTGVRGAPDVDALATRRGGEVSVLLWNYHDDDRTAPDAAISLLVSGLAAGPAQVRHYRIDERHSNAYTLWKELDRPQSPMPEQYARLERTGQLQLLGSPEWKQVRDGRVELRFSLPRQGVSLIQITPER
jgi:xylan 1,4-beta-xylosidase